MPTRSYLEYVSATQKVHLVADDVVFKFDSTGKLELTGLLYTKSTLSGATTVDATTPVLNFSLGDSFELAMPAGDREATFSNPRRGNFVLKVQHETSARVLTFPTAYWSAVTGTSAVAYTLPAGTTKFTIFNIFCDATSYWISDIPFWAS
jgi:hypothetical protein